MNAAYIVYRLPQYPIPFPRKLICEYEDPEKLKAALNLTEEEFDKALDGEVIRDEFVIDLNPEIYKMIQNDHAKSPEKKHLVVLDEPLKEQKVAELLGISVGNVKRVVHDTRAKILKNGTLVALLCDIVACQSGSSARYCVYMTSNMEVTDE